MTTAASEHRICTNKLLMDIIEFDKALFDTSNLSVDEIKYFNSIIDGFNNQTQFYIDWLDSDEARRIFYENEQYNDHTFAKIDEQIKEIVHDTSLKADEIISRIYDSGLQAGADEIKRTRYYNDATKYGLHFLQSYNFELISNVNDDLKNHIREEIFAGIAAGEGMPEVAKRILDATNHSLTGKTLSARQRAMMIARTESARAMTQGRLQSYANYGVHEVKILTAGDDNVCAICREAETKIYLIENAGDLVPFHPLCRCSVTAYIRHGILPRNGDKFAPVIISAPSFKSSKIPSIISSDNTRIPILEKEKIKSNIEELSEFANGKPIEYGEIYDVHGNSLVDLIVGDDGSIPISWQEIKVLVDNYGALILIHTHPSLFDNLHSVRDITSQLKSGLKYSIVDSYTKRYIIVNENNALSEDNPLVKNLENFGNDFYQKVDNIVEKRMSYEYDVNQLDYWQQERLREKLTVQVTEENFREYEEGILNFCNDENGLKLYVHDKKEDEQI